METAYRKARKEKGFNTLRASTDLYISERTLYYYESGEVVPEDTMVLKMAKLYDAKWLLYEHLKRNVIAVDILKTSKESLGFAHLVLQLEKELNDFSKLKEQLIAIAYDDEISVDEKAKFEQIKTKLIDLIKVALEISMRRW